MGHTKHHMIVVTCREREQANVARDKLLDIVGSEFEHHWSVSGIVSGHANMVHTFFLGPDGSKEGWKESAKGDKVRNRFILWLNTQCHEDGSSLYAWAEVLYYDDEGGATEIVRRSS